MSRSQRCARHAAQQRRRHRHRPDHHRDADAQYAHHRQAQHDQSGLVSVHRSRPGRPTSSSSRCRPAISSARRMPGGQRHDRQRCQNHNRSHSDLITIAENDDQQIWDAGLVPLASIGDFVWVDQNNNGIQDGGANEPGLDGVTVHLLDSITAIDNPNLPGIQPYILTTAGGGALPVRPTCRPMCPISSSSTSPAHYQRSPADAIGSTDANDSDASLTTAQPGRTFLSPKEYDRHGRRRLRAAGDAGRFRLE